MKPSPRKAASRRYYLANREKLIAKVKAYYRRNRKRVLEYKADYYADRHLDLAQIAREYRRNNKQKISLQRLKWPSRRKPLTTNPAR